MTREQLLKIEGITEQMLKPILDMNGIDVEKAKEDGKQFKSKLDPLETENKRLASQLETVVAEKAGLEKTNEDLKSCKVKLEEFEKKEKEQAELQRKAAEESAIFEKIDGIMKDKEYVNEFTRDTIRNKIKELSGLEEYKGKGFLEIHDSLTNDKEGIFKNPNVGIVIPPAGNVQTDNKTFIPPLLI